MQHGTKHRTRSIIVSCTAVLALAGSGAAASAKTVTYKNVVSPSKQISCSAVIGSTEIECMAPYLPEIGEFDPYLAVRSHGAAILSQRSDFPGFSTPRRKLAYGNTWKRPGIRCTMRTSGLNCHNLDGHGFHIARDDVRRF